MDIKQIIRDNLAEGAELSEKTIAGIVKEIQKAMGEETIPKEWYSKKTEEWDKRRQELETAIQEVTNKSADYDALQKAFEEAKKALEDEQKAHKAVLEGYAAEKNAAALDAKVGALLKEAKLHDSVIPKALKFYDRAIVELDNGGDIQNADKILEAFRAEWGDFFGEISKRGADVGTPPHTKANAKDLFIQGFDS